MWNYTVTRVWGIPIRVNVSLLVFLPVLAWLIGSGEQMAFYADLIEGLTGVAVDVAPLRAGPMPWIVGTAAAVGLFVSVAVHELGHSWVALRYGLEIDSITLWILGGLASLKSFPREWDREFWIAIAGPTTSLLVAAVFFGAVRVIPASLDAALFVAGWLAVTNVVLAAFNLLPAFPMDGGRVFRALLARSRPYAVATRTAARVGVVFALAFFVVGVLQFSPLLVLLALFLYGAATTESRLVLLDELLEGLTAADVMTRNPPAISADATVADLVERMLADRLTTYPVVEDGRTVGVVTLADLRDVDDRGGTTVRTVTREAPTVAAASDAFETLSQLTQTGDQLALVEDDGSVAGLLTREDFARALEVRREFRSGPR